MAEEPLTDIYEPHERGDADFVCHRAGRYVGAGARLPLVCDELRTLAAQKLAQE